MNQRVLIKLGGAALCKNSTLDVVTRGIQKFLSEGFQIIVVHGGGPAINDELTRRNINWTFLNGQRVTTPEMMAVIASTLGEQVNNQLLKHFIASGVSAIRLSTVQQKTLLCKQQSAELGLVGEIQHVQAEGIDHLLRTSPQTVPVIAPIGVGSDGQNYNINADWAAAHLAVALNVDSLIYLTDQNGVWDQDKNMCSQLNETQIQTLIDDGSVQGGMLTKMRSVLFALRNGVSPVQIMNGAVADAMDLNKTQGTLCVVSQQPLSQEMAGVCVTI